MLTRGHGGRRESDSERMGTALPERLPHSSNELGLELAILSTSEPSARGPEPSFSLSLTLATRLLLAVRPSQHSLAAPTGSTQRTTGTSCLNFAQFPEPVGPSATRAKDNRLGWERTFTIHKTTRGQSDEQVLGGPGTDRERVPSRVRSQVLRSCMKSSETLRGSTVKKSSDYTVPCKRGRSGFYRRCAAYIRSRRTRNILQPLRSMHVAFPPSTVPL